MNNEYYGVATTPTSDYLAHYGIRGMKWGVRKAINKSNDVALARQYKKAQKKLARLNKKADLSKQTEIAKKYGKAAKISGTIGAAGAISSVGAHHLQKRNWTKFENTAQDMYNMLHPRKDGGINVLGGKRTEKFVMENPAAKKLHEGHLDTHNQLDNMKYISGVLGAAGLATGAITGARALAAKRHTTTGGHAAAVAKRNEFTREMNKAFAGTKYAKQPSVPKKKKRR